MLPEVRRRIRRARHLQGLQSQAGQVILLALGALGAAYMAVVLVGAAAWVTAWGLRAVFDHMPRMAQLHHARYYADAAILIAGLALWTVAAGWVLDKSGSALPRVALRRLRLG